MLANTAKVDKVYTFGEAFSDGRLCEVGHYRPFKLREALALSERLGRELTKEEVEKFYY